METKKVTSLADIKEIVKVEDAPDQAVMMLREILQTQKAMCSVLTGINGAIAALQKQIDGEAEAPSKPPKERQRNNVLKETWLLVRETIGDGYPYSVRGVHERVNSKLPVQISLSTMTNAMVRLEQEGLVQREGYSWRITEKGKQDGQ